MLRENLSIINIIFKCRTLCYNRRGTIFRCKNTSFFYSYKKKLNDYFHFILYDFGNNLIFFIFTKSISYSTVHFISSVTRDLP